MLLLIGMIDWPATPLIFLSLLPCTASFDGVWDLTVNAVGLHSQSRIGRRSVPDRAESGPDVFNTTWAQPSPWSDKAPQVEQRRNTALS